MLISSPRATAARPLRLCSQASASQVVDPARLVGTYAAASHPDGGRSVTPREPAGLNAEKFSPRLNLGESR